MARRHGRFWNVMSWFNSRLWLIPAGMSLLALGAAYALVRYSFKNPSTPTTLYGSSAATPPPRAGSSLRSFRA